MCIGVQESADRRVPLSPQKTPMSPMEIPADNLSPKNGLGAYCVEKVKGVGWRLVRFKTQKSQRSQFRGFYWGQRRSPDTTLSLIGTPE